MEHIVTIPTAGIGNAAFFIFSPYSAGSQFVTRFIDTLLLNRDPVLKRPPLRSASSLKASSRQHQQGGSVLLLAALFEPGLDQLFDDDVGGASVGDRDAL
jgi:hypothetical protein